MSIDDEVHNEIVACVANVSFLLSRRRIKQASQQTSTGAKVRRGGGGGGGVSNKEGEVEVGEMESLWPPVFFLTDSRSCRPELTQ